MTLSSSRPVIDRRIWKYGLLFILILAGLFAPSGTAETIRAALADAYIQVSSFVALTLMIFYFLEHHLRLDTAHLLKRHEKWQVPIAAIVGALPGCGGAIIIITQYVLGRIGFGSMVAVLTSTMGDAAFLLLAQEPKTALIVMAGSITLGTLTGWSVEALHGKDFLRAKQDDWHHFRTQCGRIVQYGSTTLWSWYGILLPGVILGISAAFQIDTDIWFGAFSAYEPTVWIGFIGALYCLYIWAILPDKGLSMVNLAAHPACRTHVKNRNRIIFETSFVTTWVILAFLIFELTLHWTNFDLATMFKIAAPFVPLIAIIIGFIPGCGPQILVTTLYLNGIVPFSAQMGNAISNDGDALFPALALAPRTAILATIYTAIPALIAGYGLYFVGL